MANTQEIPVRPLTKGIIQNRRTTEVPLGGFLDITNFLSTERGLRRRGGLSVYRDLTAVGYPPLRGMETFWNTSGNKITIVFDTKFIYQVSSTAYSRVEWTYTTGTLSTSGATATGSGTAWNTAANYLYPGDLMVLDADGSGDGPEEILISAIGSDTSITLASTPVGTYGAGTDYKIVRAFKLTGENFVDWTTLSDTLYYTDNTRPVVKWDGSAFSVINSGASVCKALTYFKDRLFLANVFTVSGSTYHKQRIAWGAVTSETIDNTQDLPYTSDEILRIVPLGSLLVLYFNNSIWYGQPTNVGGSSQPYVYQKLSADSVGLVGPRAIAEWNDGHFFIGSDNIYVMSPNTAITPIGDAVFDEIRESTNYLWASYVAIDVENDSVVFGIPTNSQNYLQNYYYYNYRTQAWSKTTGTGGLLANKSLQDITTYDELTGTYDDLTGTYDELSGGAQGIKLWHSLNGSISSFDDSSTDDEGSGFSIQFITGDIDLDSPNIDKGWFGMSLRLREPYSSALSGNNFTLNLDVSFDGGYTWTNKGQFSFVDNQIEDRINFRGLGATARFKLYNQSSMVDQVVIEEFVLTVKGAGKEVPNEQHG